VESDAIQYTPDAPQEKQYDDYWGFEERHQFMMPDGIQYIEYKVMTEGDRQKYQKLTNRDITMSRQTGDAKMKVDPAEDRNALLHVAVTGWNMYRGGSPVTFSNDNKNATFQQWVKAANPRLVEDLEKAVRMANPWLLGDMKSEDIEKEIANLQDMLKLAQEREAGNAS
jgi:hypothetical protein